MAARSVLFAAGGSGGHLFPALAVAEELSASRVAIGIAASEKPIDRAVLTGSSHTIWHLPSVSPSRIWREPFTTVRHAWTSWKGAKTLIREAAPAVVVGCGGFASAPVVWAAIRAGIPVVLLEQNLIPGRANLWLSRWASRICLSFEETRAWLPSGVVKRPDLVHMTGNPIRKSMTAASSEPRDRRHLLILGGSQGARHLNEAVATWLLSRPECLSDWYVTHQTGAADYESIRRRYAVLTGSMAVTAIDFIRDPEPVYRKATLVIGRAGATSLAELACLGTPTILVPLPSAARDHQTANARWFADRGAARMLIQSDSPSETAKHLSELFEGAVSDRESLGQRNRDLARPDAAAQVAQIVLSLI